jgi:hypothetical protein
MGSGRVEIVTLNAEVDFRWDDEKNKRLPTLVLKYGDAEVLCWSITELEAHQGRGYGGDESYLEELVAEKLRELWLSKDK